MSGCRREWGINVVNEKLVDFSLPMNLFSIRCSPSSDTSGQLECTKIKEQIRMSFPPLTPWSSIEDWQKLISSQIRAIFNCTSSHFTPFWTFQSVWSFVPWEGKKKVYSKYINCKWSAFQMPSTQMMHTHIFCKYLFMFIKHLREMVPKHLWRFWKTDMSRPHPRSTESKPLVFPWLGWLSWLSVSLGTEMSLVQFLVRAHAWVAGQGPS